MKAVGYIRVSTSGQVEDGVSLDSQRQKLEAWASLNDCELVGIFEDAGISGGKMSNREGLQRALDAACSLKTALVVYSLSRLARSTKDALCISERLEKAGGDLVSLSERIDTTTAAGKMVFRMLSVLSEFERDQISERTSSAMQYLKREGRYTGGRARYGYSVDADGRLRENEKEQEIIRTARELSSKGNGLSSTARLLEERGYLSRSGRSFHATQIRQMLT